LSRPRRLPSPHGWVPEDPGPGGTAAGGFTASAEAEREAFLRDVTLGLRGRPKALSSRFFYDAEGSRLFEAIMRLPEYYLTACEARILETRSGDILDAYGPAPFRLADLGAGNGAKTRHLLDHGLRRGTLLGYLPVDVSVDALARLAGSLAAEHPGLLVTPLEGDYLEALTADSPGHQGRRLVLFLGSNIGNFARAPATAFLRGLRAALGPGDGLLIGFDLRKDPRRIIRAYSDASGVTARFNLNLLARINRELGGAFRAEDFRHVAVYDEEEGAARSYLVSRRRHAVTIEAAGFAASFEDGESIHTESSFKYSPGEIEAMARESGFIPKAHFQDPTGSFVDSLWLPA
jgi:dimethylhistidine N-methyltransferase